MSIKNLRNSLICLALGLPMMSAFAADQWHFKVTNKTSGNMTKLQVSEDKSTWGAFDIGSGIAAGETATLVWGANDTSGCNQWIRAQFSDGSFSAPVKEDFCHDLDSPIEFSE